MIAKEILMRHKKAFEINVDAQQLELGGDLHWRKGEGTHLLSPDAIAKLQHSCRTDDYSIYKEYAGQINDQSRKLKTIRGLLKFKKQESIPLDEVESVENIIQKFCNWSHVFWIFE